MTNKEKAQHLVNRFINLINYDFISDPNWKSPIDEERHRRVRKDAKHCALAVVDEVLNNVPAANLDWEKVKKELEKL